MVDRIIDRTADWRVGDPLDPANALGAIVSQEQFDKINGFINGARKKGVSLLNPTQAKHDPKGLFISPTIFGDVKPDMDIAIQEIFGPVMAIMPVGSDQEAINLANQTQYGLQASLFTSDVARAAHMCTPA